VAADDRPNEGRTRLVGSARTAVHARATPDATDVARPRTPLTVRLSREAVLLQPLDARHGVGQSRAAACRCGRQLRR
jgi:hypothetical protein